VKDTPAIIALVAALGLVALTVAAFVRPVADLNFWHIGTMALAWVAVLASALAAHDREGETAADDEPRRVDAEDRRHHRRAVSGAPAPSGQSVWEGSPQLLEFARELHATLESDRLRLLISQRLPLLLGLRDLWIVARFGNRQQIIVPSPTGTAEGLPFVTDDAREWSTYPLKADGQTIGTMGIGLPPVGFTERDHRLFKLVATFVAQSLSTANAFETMREASLMDPLTGCVTRAEGARRFEAELRRAHRTGSSLAVLMLDLDHFKGVNDMFGHKAGDAVLSAVGDTLLTTLRASDVRCRWGGEEFLILLPDSNAERAQRASDKLRRRIANTPVGAGGRVINVTASIGLTLSAPHETDIHLLTARADPAMYDAKRQGRNCIRIVLSDSSSPQGLGEPGPGAPASEHATTDGRVEARVAETFPPALVSGAWNGVERRDPLRHDRRRAASPGRRSTDATVGSGWGRER
jgi:diguanylate cyclase (GGDEF)-like protein